MAVWRYQGRSPTAHKPTTSLWQANSSWLTRCCCTSMGFYYYKPNWMVDNEKREDKLKYNKQSAYSFIVNWSSDLCLLFLLPSVDDLADKQINLRVNYGTVCLRWLLRFRFLSFSVLKCAQLVTTSVPHMQIFALLLPICPLISVLVPAIQCSALPDASRPRPRCCRRRRRRHRATEHTCASVLKWAHFIIDTSVLTMVKTESRVGKRNREPLTNSRTVSLKALTSAGRWEPRNWVENITQSFTWQTSLKQWLKCRILQWGSNQVPAANKNKTYIVEWEGQCQHMHKVSNYRITCTSTGMKCLVWWHCHWPVIGIHLIYC